MLSVVVHVDVDVVAVVVVGVCLCCCCCKLFLLLLFMLLWLVFMLLFISLLFFFFIIVNCCGLHCCLSCSCFRLNSKHTVKTYLLFKVILKGHSFLLCHTFYFILLFIALFPKRVKFTSLLDNWCGEKHASNVKTSNFYELEDEGSTSLSLITFAD